MTLGRRTSTLIVAAFVGIVACSSDEAATSPPPSAAATTYTAAYCERLDRCRTRASRDSFGDVATCTRRFLPDIDDEFRSPGTRITEAMADACAAKMREAPCDVLISAIIECRFSGGLDDGAGCGSGYQCKSSSCARGSDSSGASALCGTCSARVAEGSDCTNANCATGFVCAEGRCKSLAKAGEACDTRPCTPDLQCFKGRCERPLGPGAECVAGTLDEDVLACDTAQLLQCVSSATDPEKGRCLSVRHASLGSTCGFDPTTNELVACSGGSCTNLGAGGTCISDLKEGETCGSTEAACEVPLYCVGGRCGRVSIHTCR